MRIKERGWIWAELLVVLLLTMAGDVLFAGQIYIVGNNIDREVARDAGLAGSYVSECDEIPAGANVVVLGRADAAGGVDEAEYESLAGDGCRSIRLGAKNRLDVKQAAASLKKMIDAGADPFADVSRTMGLIEASREYPLLSQAELNKQGKTSLNPQFQPQNLFPRAATPTVDLSPEASSLASKLDRDGRVALYINFSPQSPVINPRSFPTLRQVLDLLKARPAMKLLIEGHTDNYLSSEFNQTLSEQRAYNVRRWLADRGAVAGNLTSVGYGETRPIAPNFTSAGRARNRRVEIVKVR
ncbi:MAG TPA: OmpA family protein [Candidatus Ozemobacteraceae bacterium]|nr:OmpA family protein [Candidatus Ozemobacteraceae bacterium]